MDRRLARRVPRRGRAGAAQHPVQGRGGRRTCLRTSQARYLLTVTDFLDGDYLAMLDGAEGLAELERWWSSPARVRRARARGTSSSPPGPVDDRRRAAGPGGGRRPGRHLRHHLHLGDDRRAEGRHAQPRRQRADLRRLVATWSGCARATATSSCTRSSTPPDSRRGSWRRS